MANKLITHSPMALRHYREQLSLSRELLSKKSRVPLNKIIKAENSEHSELLTFNQLENIAKVLLIPEFYLLSNKLQKSNLPDLIDHRNQSDILDEENQYQLKRVIKEVTSGREDLIYTYECLDVEPSSFKLKLQGNNSLKDSLAIREFLGVSNANFKVDGDDDYYKSWRILVEKKDILVFEISRKKIGSEGMALYYPLLPIITILSSGQTNSRKLFTMVHELVHLGLRESAIDGKILKSNYDIEKYCNEVAGYVLVPELELQENYDNKLSLKNNVEVIRKKLKVSKQAIAIQLKLTGRISQEELNDYLEQLSSKSSAGFGKTGRQYSAANKFGKIYLQQVISAVWDSNLSVNTAMKILNLNNVEQLSYLEQKVFG
ncbi:ImmA/IrrE family metallo-endopeptidase [Psychrobacter sp. FDAARGOS_221]|uniref:ImmA/IrrE family metallo-endopeptidase n=1 Tax=Psychrobacter sp. FDAARGOS_221 TaxID=1975705 RepID=UPI000BB5775C|nr:ImmA/IrrE family metallo-endopeptidase [Psychrobacter sp. FDAARGOS_221]PNK59509.1 ImmA/IrrE family metallo-endopeptidase [Psychrobacter sp. FDAARGOS_221]